MNTLLIFVAAVFPASFIQPTLTLLETSSASSRLCRLSYLVSALLVLACAKGVAVVGRASSGLSTTWNKNKASRFAASYPQNGRMNKEKPVEVWPFVVDRD